LLENTVYPISNSYRGQQVDCRQKLSSLSLTFYYFMQLQCLLSSHHCWLLIASGLGWPAQKCSSENHFATGWLLDQGFWNQKPRNASTSIEQYVKQRSIQRHFEFLRYSVPSYYYYKHTPINTVNCYVIASIDDPKYTKNFWFEFFNDHNDEHQYIYRLTTRVQ
jgi:hypothetical protein